MQSFEGLKSLFQHQYETLTLHHSWVIEGADETLVLPQIRDIVSMVFCDQITEANFHPNLYWMNAYESRAVEDVRLAIQFLGKTSWDGGWKVCVIVGADQLNPQGQNALLKVVEEPPEKTVIFLISKRANTLLPTLYSRGLHIVLSSDEGQTQPEKEGFCKKWLDAITQIVDHQNYESLFTLQTYLLDNEVDAQEQGKWVLQALKQVIDAHHYPANRGFSNRDRLLTVFTQSEWLKRWESAQHYLEQGSKFMVDQKQMCIKLTTKIFWSLA